MNRTGGGLRLSAGFALVPKSKDPHRYNSAHDDAPRAVSVTPYVSAGAKALVVPVTEGIDSAQSQGLAPILQPPGGRFCRDP